MEDNLGLMDSEIHSNASLFLGSMICSRSDIYNGTGNFESMNDDSHSPLITSGQKGPQKYVANGSTEREASELGSSFIMNSSGTHLNCLTSSSEKPDVLSTIVVVSQDSLLLPSLSAGSVALAVDRSVSQSPVPPSSSSSSFCVGISSTPGVVSPSKLSSPSLLPAPLQPLLSPPTSSTTSSPIAQSFTDLKPMTLMSVEGCQIANVSQTSFSTKSTTNATRNISKTCGEDEPQPAPRTSSSSRTYDFSPSSKDSPLKPLKSLRRRPPPPPLGSHKNRKNYFSAHKQSNLRRAVLEKSLVKKSPECRSDSKIATSKWTEKVDPVDSFPPNNPTENSNLPLCNPTRVVQAPGIADNVKRSVVNDFANDRSSIDSRPAIKLLENVTDASSNPNVSGSFPRRTSECVLEKNKVLCKNVSVHSSASVNTIGINTPLLNKRKRGRPRKTESTLAPDDPSLIDARTSKALPQNSTKKEDFDAIVTRHTTYRRGNNRVMDDTDDDFSPPPKRAYRRRICTPTSDHIFTRSANRKNQSSCDSDQQFISSNSRFKNTIESFSYNEGKNEGREKRNSKKCAVVLQGGFKKSGEFKSHYIQS